ncbi:MAG: GNAT family N-acetyltransferase [Bifidobacterium longum]|nr:GNAT family N-acetyltransferase [Bifidobacterium longum]
MSEAIIRTLRKDDYPALIDLVRRTWYAEYDERTGLLAAEADWENCLARVTTAFVAELEDKPVALIVGRIDELDHRSPLNMHRRHSLRKLLQLAFAHDGMAAASEILGTLHVDRQLRKQAANIGHEYSAEVVLFVLDPAARGHGLGRRMFETMMSAFRAAGQSLPASVPGENPSSFYLYEGSVPEPA